ncbi:hypothetical protein D3C80_2211560 [compost metagenome]
MAAGASLMIDTSPWMLLARASRMIISSWAVALTFEPSAPTPYFLAKFSAISTILPVLS